MTRTRKGHGAGFRRLRLGCGFLGLVLLSAWATQVYRSLPDPGALNRQNPKTTALIEQRSLEAQKLGKKPRRFQEWVPLSAISPRAVELVVLSEDAAFYRHEGIDTHELKIALEDAWKKKELGRGASTITQQLAKNLWLSGDRSLWRKVKELVLTRRLEERLSKNRILALYLNVVEWGPGVYGIQAGALEHFKVPAAEVTVAQAAMLAAMLPAPRRWLPSSHSPRLQKRALHLIDLLERIHRISAEEAAVAREEIERTLGRTPAVEVTDPADEGDFE